jgi:hypothetical protein
MEKIIITSVGSGFEESNGGKVLAVEVDTDRQGAEG